MGSRVCVRTLHLVPQGLLKVAQDVVLGNGKQAGQSREGRLNTGAECQSPLRDYSMARS